nr:MAG TPA: hypothetical protein [Caudoviricetes sp.]
MILLESPRGLESLRDFPQALSFWPGVTFILSHTRTYERRICPYDIYK